MRNQVLGMSFWVVHGVLLDGYALDQANVLNVPVIIFIRVYVAAFDVHCELINLEIKSFCYFLSQETYCLEVADVNLLLRRVIFEKNGNV